MEPQTSFKRYPAVKINIKILMEGKFCPGDEKALSYLEMEEEKIYRLNLMATVIDKEKIGSITNFSIDDGTGIINLRFFVEEIIIDLLNIGETILIIGKLRQYNQEKYVAPEIVRKIDPLWLKARKIELKKEKKRGIKTELVRTESSIIVEEDINEADEKNEVLPTEKIIQLIKKLDHGDGVPIEAVLENSYLNDAEQILERMLKNGDIFQIMPGKVKVL